MDNKNTTKSIQLHKKIENEDELYTNTLHEEQKSMIQSLYIEPSKREKKENKKVIEHIKRKCQSYKQQDIKKKRIISSYTLFSLDDVLELLVKSKCICSYCLKPVFIQYYHERYPQQWTLDRIDNDKPHIISNLVVSCLKCNLQKRRQCDSHFRFGKQMRIQKIE